MAEYNLTEGAGRAFTRCHTIILRSPDSGPGEAVFHEERGLEVTGEQVKTPLPLNLIVPVGDMSKTFPVLDPVTWEPTGETKSFLDIYQLLGSAYFALAAERDQPLP
jgi:hypothetical protein